MEEFKSGDGKQHMVAAVLHLTKALVASDFMSEDLKKIIDDLDSCLSSMVVIASETKRESSAIEQRLSFAEASVAAWKFGTSEVTEKIRCIDEISAVIESLRAEDDHRHKPTELLYRAESLLHTAMSALEQDLNSILRHHRLCFDPENASLEMHYDESSVSSKEDSPGERTVDLVQSIARSMFASDYGAEFCLTFVGARKAAMEEYMEIWGMDNFTVEEILKMEMKKLNQEIKRWTRIVKIMIRCYLPGEKRLCDQILTGLGSAAEGCYVETSKASTTRLLNFGFAVTMGHRQPEKLFRLLDMHEILNDLSLEINLLLPEKNGDEFRDLSEKLSELVTATLVEFACSVAASASTAPFPGGGIHPLAKYVMNYTQTLAEYSLMKDTAQPAAAQLLSVVLALETGLEARAKLYKDGALQHVFLMNNLHYIVEKVKTSALRRLLGDAWIRERIVWVQQHATGYVRMAWGSALALLSSSDGGALPRAMFRDRCRRFSAAFEGVYRSQTAWFIKDPRLREDLQISVSQKVIQAYRNFTGRNSDDEKHIKYGAGDLEILLLDLFGGTSRSLRSSRW